MDLQVRQAGGNAWIEKPPNLATVGSRRAMAILDAAAASGYVPLRGKLPDVTVINAQHFTWDGGSVGFVLTADNATPPPPPPPDDPEEDPSPED